MNLDLLQQPFNQSTFEDFIKNIIPIKEIDTRFKKDDLNEETLKHISAYKYLGKARLSDKSSLGVFIFKSKHKNIENKRVSFSKIIPLLSKKQIVTHALVAIYHENSDVWRFSYVSFSVKDGKILVNTSMKRYTYELGLNIPIKTAENQIKLLTHEKITKKLLEEIFSVEKVSKEFFESYKKLYRVLVEDILVVVKKNRDEIQKESHAIIKNELKIKSYIKKMLGRIVFLYFVQKKGWLNNDKKFLSNLFHKYTKEYPNENFYDKVLEQLFITGLNQSGETWKAFDGQAYEVPYLNGGLFDADKEDKLDISIPNDDLKEVFKLFDSYNFTIIEDTPHESEVAIDPEMLGRVFEDLLEDRKEKGAFYTPREIVHYMCQESIVNYLKTKPKEQTDLEYIKQIKILDPAIGSGAFPMGMLHEITQMRIELGDTADIATIKREVIQNSIHGIDIEPSAVEIAKLRFWLSIVVDEEKPKPLPNLAYKIMVGNSLIETLEGVDPLKERKKGSKVEKQRIECLNILDTLIKSYYEEQSNKNQLKQKITDNFNILFKDISKEYPLFKESLITGASSKDIKAREIAKTISDLKSNHHSNKIFLYKLFFRDVLDKGGFDVVIGNPPYVGEKGKKHIFRPLQNEFKDRYEAGSDLFYYFFMKSIDILKEDGVLAFITTNYFLTADGAIKLRTEFKNRMAISNIINFNEMKLFQSALGQHNIITILKKTKRDIDSNIVNILKPQDKFDKNIFIESKEIEVFTMKSSALYDGDKNYIRISKQGNSLENVFNKMTSNAKLINKICLLGVGFKTGTDKIVKKDIDKVYNEKPANINFKDGVFILNEKEFNQIKPEKDLIYKCYKSSDITKYTSNSWKNIYVIWTNKDTNIDKYPNIKNHLEKFKKILHFKMQDRGETLPWFSNYRAREYDLFTNKDKIVFPYRSKSNVFAYSNSEYFGSGDILYLRQKDKNFNIKYILALLNSKLYYTWLYYRGKRKGETLELYVTPIGQVPIKDISKEQQKPFEILIDKIITLKEQGKETKHLEDEIDSMVYALYELSDNEIKIIEEN